MAEHHITFVRDTDRTRLIFALEGDLADCVQRALEKAPHGWRMCALNADVRPGRLTIPEDNDDYRG